MPTRRQTLPQITLRYAPDEVSGQPTWKLTVSDGEHTAEPVKVSPETAAGIAQIVDVALPLPIDLNGEQTSAERVVRFAHVQTLEAQLAKAQAGLKSTAFARTTTVPGPDTEPAAPAPRAARGRRGAAAKGKDKDAPVEGEVATVVPIHPVPAEAPAPAPVEDEIPVLETVADGGVPLPDEPPLVDEPPRFSDLPETLPRRSHLEVPPIDEF